MSSTADQLARIEAEMASLQTRHTKLLWRWQALRSHQRRLREMVAREDAAMDRQARKYLGASAKRSA